MVPDTEVPDTEEADTEEADTEGVADTRMNLQTVWERDHSTFAYYRRLPQDLDNMSYQTVPLHQEVSLPPLSALRI